jgi:Raf kinase inhibitor-like YbhB/YbcL family protein
MSFQAEMSKQPNSLCSTARICVVTSACAILALTSIAYPQRLGIKMQSKAFRDGSAIPDRYTCSANDLSPPLSWSGLPEATRSLAIVVYDTDAPSGNFVHWIAYDLPANQLGLPASVPKRTTLLGGGSQGLNDFGQVGYNGPCPPPGPAHHYHFNVFALSSMLNLEPRTTSERMEQAMQGKILATGDLVAIFGR